MWLLPRPANRCAVSMIVGRVACVSVTGATAVIDGWTIPVDEVQSICLATDTDADLYAHLMHAMREKEAQR
jgi:hypothetical protein